VSVVGNSSGLKIDACARVSISASFSVRGMFDDLLQRPPAHAQSSGSSGNGQAERLQAEGLEYQQEPTAAQAKPATREPRSASGKPEVMVTGHRQVDPAAQQHGGTRFRGHRSPWENRGGRSSRWERVGGRMRSVARELHRGVAVADAGVQDRHRPGDIRLLWDSLKHC